MVYRKRILEDELRLCLAAAGAVVIEGTRACGKTVTARRFAKSEVLFDVDDQSRRAARLTPAHLLAGSVPRLLDEWQLAPNIWNHVRRAVDARARQGQFILTGSAVPMSDKTRHSGAGRFARLRMRPMSLFELGYASGTIALRALLKGKTASSAPAALTVPKIAEIIAVGGWPALQDSTLAEALRFSRNYLAEACHLDIRQLGTTTHAPGRISRLLHSYARNIASYASTATLAADAAEFGLPMKDQTVQLYMDALERLMLIEDQPAWGPHLRSKSRLRRMAKRHFVDPSLAVAALRATPARLLKDLNLLGFLFEALVVRDLRIYAQAADAQILQYRDNTGLEIDIIVEAADGRWVALEVKLGDDQIDAAAKNLLKLRQRVDTEKCGPPAALGIITATGYGYTRKDGVAVIPIGTLGP